MEFSLFNLFFRDCGNAVCWKAEGKIIEIFLYQHCDGVTRKSGPAKQGGSLAPAGREKPLGILFIFGRFERMMCDAEISIHQSLRFD